MLSSQLLISLSVAILLVEELQFAGGSEDANLVPGVENSIPVIEIRGEGKPMSSAQIRLLEEQSNGRPLDIKVEKTSSPTGKCSKPARRTDFVTFHYKGFTEDGRMFDQTYGKLSTGVKIQLGVGMTLPGLDKGMKGMCEQEQRRIKIPWRLCQRRKSKVWKKFPTEEHWIIVDVEMIKLEEWTAALQFEFIDQNKDLHLDQEEVLKFGEKMKEYGKTWENRDIDNVQAARYYIRYFDRNRDNLVDLDEMVGTFKQDMMVMNSTKRSLKNQTNVARKRDPGLEWIIDFNNDGIVTREEIDSADSVFAGEPNLLQDKKDEL